MEVPVVVGDHDQSLALSFEIGEQLFIKDAPEGRVLLRRPLVEHQDGSPLQIDLDERQALALARR